MRCCICGSNQVTIVSNSSYSMKKGIAGALVLGPVGAIAGINGKQSTNYHCMKCGQDSFCVMDSFIEQSIDHAVKNGDNESLDMFRRTWRNVEKSTNASHNTDYSKVAGSEIKKKAKESSQDIKVAIKEDISNRKIPYEYYELVDKYDNNYAAIKAVLAEGAAREVFVEDKAFIVPATSVEEIKQFALIEAAGFGTRKDIKDEYVVFDDVINVVKERGDISLIDLQVEYAALHPELVIEGNPYSITRLVEELVYELNKDGHIVYKKGVISLPSIVDKEAFYKEEAKKTSFISEWGKDVYNAMYKRIGERQTSSEIIEQLKKLDIRAQYDSDDEIDFWGYHDSNTPQVFCELLHLVDEGLVTNEIDENNSYWILIDKEKEKRESLKNEIAGLAYRISTLKKEYQKIEKECQEALLSSGLDNYSEDSETVRVIETNKAKIKELELLMPSLRGFFKRKQLKNTEMEIKKLLDENNSLQIRLNSERDEFNRKRKEIEAPKQNIANELERIETLVASKEQELESL